MKMLLGVVLLAGSAYGQNALYLDISGQWKIADRDDPAYSQPNFDDSQWPGLKVPMHFRMLTDYRKVPTGCFWLRHQLNVQPEVDLSNIALTVGGLAEVYEVYINGRLIGSTGPFTTSAAQLARPRTFDLPPLGSRRLVIAIRALYRMPAIQAAWLIDDTGPYLLTSRENAPRNAAQAVIDRRRKERSPRVAVAAASFLLSVVIFFAWLSARDRSELICLSAMLLCNCVELLHQFVLTNLESMPWRDTLTPALLASALPFALQSELVLAIFHVRKAALRAVAWVIAALLLLWGGSQWYFYAAECWILVLILWPWKTGATTRARWVEFALLRIACLAIFWQFTLARGGFVRVLFYGMGARGIQGALGTGTFWTGDLSWPRYPVAVLIFSLVIAVILLRRLTLDSHEKLRLTAELEAARTVQQLLVSSSIDGAETVYRPAQEVGGDFYWTVKLDDGSLLIAVGDVSGKGLKAAMLVSAAIGCLRSTRETSPVRILEHLNRAAMGSGGFVTAVVARIDGTCLRLASAGHPAPYRDGQELPVQPGIPLGIDADIVYSEQQFEPGSQLTFVSDGVLEAANSKGELFGFDRTAGVSRKSAAEIAEAAVSWGQNDDITVVTVRRQS